MKKKIITILFAVLLFTALSITAFAYTKGDVDGNEKITASDARLALRYSAQLEVLTDEQLAAADVDGSGKVTASDARKILRVSAKLDPPLEKINIDTYLIENGVLNIAVEDNRYPFSYVENGEIKGCNIELFKRIEEYYDVEVKFHAVKYYKMKDEIDNGNYDIAIYSDTVYFNNSYNFSDVFYSNVQHAVVRKYISSIDELKNMTGIKIGVVKNSLAEKILLKDQELGVLKAESVVGYASCLDGKKALQNEEIYAFVTDYNSATYMSDDAYDGIILSKAYNNENYLFFGDPDSGELIDLLSRVVNAKQAEEIVDKYSHYDVNSEIIPSAYSVDIAPGGTAIIKLEVKSFYSPSPLELYNEMECPYKVILSQENYQSYDKYHLSISVPANAKSGYITIGTGSNSEGLEVRIKVNVTSSADSNYHIAGKTDIPDFGAMTKTPAEVLINGNDNIFYTYSASELNKNGVTISQARKYYEKLSANGFSFAMGYNDGYRIYENKTTGEDVIYREYYTPSGKLESIVIECVYINYLN